jgi:hypothetical protein
MENPTAYRIRVKGHLDASFASWFEGLTISNLDDGETMISGRLQDQAALQGVLNRINNLGLTLISLNAVKDES